MAQRSIVIPLLELERGPQRLEVPLTPEWLATALADTEATPRPAGGRLTAEVSLTGTEVMVRGRVTAALSMPCVRTLDPVEVDVDTELFLLLGRGAEPDERAPRGRRGGARASAGTRGAERGPRKSAAAPGPGATTAAPGPEAGRRSARGGRRTPGEEDRELSQEEAARDVYTGEQVVLDPFVREFIVLELPMMPVRPDLAETPPGAGGLAWGDTAGEEPPDLHAAKDAATPPRPEAQTTERPLDPRLAPLAELKRRLSSPKE